MSTGPVSQILFRTAIAAVNSTSHLRIYTQDTSGNIRESLYESGWANGTADNVIAPAKLGTPIAATSKELHNIRVYYLSTDNKLKERCYDASTGWYDGALNKSNITVAPYSKIGASFLPGDNKLRVRVYVQHPDNTIQEYGYDGGDAWTAQKNLGPALPGTEIASTSYYTSKLSIRVYFQAPSLNLVEKCYDSAPWYDGAFSVPDALPRTSLAVTNFNASSNGISLRVYYGAAGNYLLEKGWDSGSNGWYDGGFKQSSIPGSEVAVISWGSVQLRVYFQNGTYVTGVTEWVYSNGWKAGVKAIPPA